MDVNFVHYSKYYDLLNQNKDYYAETIYISKCIKKYSPEARTILEFGSGTGGHGIFFQNLGYDIYGLERSKLMVDKAKLNGVPCEQADITNFKVDRKFDVVVSLFHVISYINENKQLESTFRNAYNQLNSEGLFIFDVWYSPSVYYQKPENRVRKVENDDVLIIRLAEPKIHFNINVVDINFTIIVKDKKTNLWSEFQEIHPMRHYSIPELELLASFTGFKLLLAEEFLTGNLPSQHTWGITLIFQKSA